jgi:hypothetical protein
VKALARKWKRFQVVDGVRKVLFVHEKRNPLACEERAAVVSYRSAYVVCASPDGTCALPSPAHRQGPGRR